MRRRRVRAEEPEQRLRRNEQIRARQVRLIDEEGTQVGIVPIRDALDAARDAGLDLLEVAPDANPPVCRIMDWGRYRFEQKQREREQRRKQRSVEVKQLRLRPSTDEHDFNVTRRRAENFLRQGHKVRVEVRFRGREITHQELGEGMLKKLAAALEEVAVVEQRPSMEGRRMAFMLAPTAEILREAEKRAQEKEARGEAPDEDEDLGDIDDDDIDDIDDDDIEDAGIDDTADESEGDDGIDDDQE